MKGRLKKKRSVKLRADSLKRENWKTFSQTSRKMTQINKIITSYN